MSGEYIGFDCCEDALKALEVGEIDVLSYSVTTSNLLEKYKCVKLCDYASAPLVVVLDVDGSAKKIKKLATVAYFANEAHHIIDNEKVEIISYETQEECFKALVEDKVSAVLCDGYYAEHLIKSNLEYRELHIETVLSGDYTISMAVSMYCNKDVKGILSKVIGYVEPKEISEYILREGEYKAFNISEFIQENSSIIIGLMFVAMIVVLLVTRHIINDSKKIQKLMYKDGTFDIWNMNYLVFWGEKKILPEAR